MKEAKIALGYEVNVNWVSRIHINKDEFKLNEGNADGYYVSY